MAATAATAASSSSSSSSSSAVASAACAAPGGGGGGGGGHLAAAARAHHHRPTASQTLLDNCSHYRLHTGLADTWCWNCNDQASAPAMKLKKKRLFAQQPEAAAPPLRFNGALDAAVKLVRHEGLSSLWRGLSPTLLMNVPSTVVYFSVYDKAKITLGSLTPHQVERWVPALAPFTPALQSCSPLVAGVFARALTTTLVSPIELVRTKSQAAHGRRESMRTMIEQEVRRGGVLSLWRGVGPTLMRDVPFSAIYWTSYEYSKLWMLVRWGVQMDKSVLEGAQDATAHPHVADKKNLIYASFLAGAGSGMLSAAVTHPFDLVKTRRQIELYALQAHTDALPHPTTTPAIATAAPAPAHSHSHSHGHTHTAACAHSHSHHHSRSHVATAVPHSVAAAPAAAASSSSAAAASSSSASAAAAIPSTTGQVLRTIIAEEGYVGLLSGLSARMTKIAPACAIMISSYEGTCAPAAIVASNRRNARRGAARRVAFNCSACSPFLCALSFAASSSVAKMYFGNRQPPPLDPDTRHRYVD